MKKNLINGLVLITLWVAGYGFSFYMVSDSPHRIAYAQLSAWWICVYYSGVFGLTVSLLKFWIPLCAFIIMLDVSVGWNFFHPSDMSFVNAIIESFLLGTPVLFNYINKQAFLFFIKRATSIRMANSD